MPGQAPDGSPAASDAASDAAPAASGAADLGTDELARTLAGCATREEMWTRFLTDVGARAVAEIGVFRGRFAQHLLDTCPAIERYYLLDPWRHLEDWNKPANRADDEFQGYFEEVLRRTARHEGRRVVLRGRTVEVVEQIADAELDFAYIDGDHTLRGIATDLVRVYPKVRPGGWIGGDDFAATIYQHGSDFEPTFVFPFAVYFAEALGARVYALGRSQFLMQKPESRPDRPGDFVDLTGKYADVTVLAQLRRQPKRNRRATQSGAGPDHAGSVGPTLAPTTRGPRAPGARGLLRGIANRARRAGR